MERISDKHGPRIDEMLDEETAPLTHGAPVESRAEEFRAEEPLDDSSPIGAQRSSARPLDSPPGALTHEEVNERSELARHLAPARFPADRAELMAVAEEAFAPDDVIQRLRRLPPGTRFENVQAVWAASGGRLEHRAEAADAAPPQHRAEPGTPAVVKVAGAVARVGIRGVALGIGVVRAVVDTGRGVVSAARGR